MISHLITKLATFLRGLLLGAAAGGLTMAICNRLAGMDRAGYLANSLLLGNGVLLAALLGGVTGAWLALGGRRRIAAFMGLILALLAAWVAWRAAAPHLWVIDAILIGAFGEGAQVFSGFVIFAVFYLLIRWVRSICESLLLRILSRRAPGANP